MHNYPGHVSVAHDDIYAHANTRSAIVDVTSANFAELRKRDDERQLSCGQYSATCQNSAIFSQAFCPMKILFEFVELSSNAVKGSNL